MDLVDDTQVSVLNERIQTNPFDYDAYLQLIPLLDGQSLSLLEIRRRFQSHFPLDEQTWLSWLKDTTNDDSLFDLALEDYLSPALHVAYLEHVVQKKEYSREHIREIINRSIRICGNHYTRGHLVWNFYIEFETDKFLPMQGRACSILEHVSAYWTEFSNTFPASAVEGFHSQHLACVEICTRLAIHENSVKNARLESQECAGSPVTAANRKLEKVWLDYLWTEQHRDKESFLLPVLFERAIADCCLSERIWTMMLKKQGEKALLKTCLRSVRNLPASPQCWAAVLRACPNQEKRNYWMQAKAQVAQNDLLEPALMVVGLIDDISALSPQDQVEMLMVTLSKISSAEQRRELWQRIHNLSPFDESLWLMHCLEEPVYLEALNALQSSLHGINVVGREYVRSELSRKGEVACSLALDFVARKKRECKRKSLPTSSLPVMLKDKNVPVVSNVHQTKRARIEKVEDEEDEELTTKEVFIKVLPSSATKEVLRAYFGNHVHVEGAYVQTVSVKARRDGSKYAHVTFGGVRFEDAVMAAKMACTLSGSVLHNIKLEILLSNPPPKQPVEPENNDTHKVRKQQHSVLFPRVAMLAKPAKKGDNN